MRKFPAILIALGLVWPGAASAQDRTAQAQANYQALLNGSKQLGNLTPQELRDVADLDRYLRDHPDNRTPSQRCIDDEIRRAGGSVSRLERRVINMKCREPGE